MQILSRILFVVTLNLMWSVGLFGQSSGFGIQIGSAKYMFNDKNRYKPPLYTSIFLGFNRSEQIRWMTLEIGISYGIILLDWLKVTGGLKFNTKGKDVLSISNLSLFETHPMVQIRAKYLHFPLFIETGSNDLIGFRFGYILGFPLFYSEIRNDVNRVKISNPEYTDIFKLSRELEFDIKLKFAQNYRIYFGLFSGLDKIIEPVDSDIITYNGYRITMVYDFSLSGKKS